MSRTTLITTGISAPALLAVCLWSAPVSSAPADLDSRSEHDADEVIVTASALRESPLDVAQPVTVLAGEALQRMMGASLGETVASSLGVTGSYFGAAASRPIIRGQSGERVLMLEDGADALDASALSADHAVSIDGLAADQIEILKGPATLLYGNGAVGGLVNVVTHRIPSERTEDFSGAAEIRGDTALAERSVAARADAGAGPFAFHFDGFQRHTGNLRIPGEALTPALRATLASAGLQDATRGRLPNSASASRGGAMGVSWIGDQGFLGVALSRYESLYGIPGPAAEPIMGATEWLVENGPAIDMAQTRLDLRGEYRPLDSHVTAWRLRGAWNRYRHAELEADGAMGTRFDNTAQDLRLMADHTLGTLRGTLGLQWRQAELLAAGTEAFVPPSTTQNAALFIFEELPITPGTLEFGARVEQQRISVPTATRSGTSLGLAAGMVWVVSDTLNGALQVTRSQRLPGATELFAYGPHVAVGHFEIGNASLGKETANTLDLTLRGGNTDTARWSAGVFAQDFHDYLYLEPTQLVTDGLGVFRYRQGDALFTGLEVEWILPFANHGNAHGNAHDTTHHRDNSQRSGYELRLAGDLVRGRLKHGNDLPLMPPLRLTAALQHQRGPWSAHLELQWSQRQDRVAAYEPTTRAALATNGDLNWGGTWGGLDTTIFLRVNNLLNRDLRRHTSVLKEYVPLPARGLTVGVRVQF